MFSSEAFLLWRVPLLALAVLSGVQDWKRREVADWVTWPPFLAGLLLAIVRAAQGDSLPLSVCGFVLVAWYFGWMGGADARVFTGLWGLWPLAGFAGMACAGLWGLVLLLRGRGKERFPALVPVALAASLTFLVEVVKIYK